MNGVTEEVKIKAQTAFGKQMLEQLRRTSEWAYPENVEYNILKFNKIIVAGRAFGVTGAQELNDEQVKALAVLVKHYRTLEMVEEARNAIKLTLIASGVDSTIFGEEQTPPPTPPSSQA